MTDSLPGLLFSGPPQSFRPVYLGAFQPFAAIPCQACRFARLLTVNPVHEDTCKVVADLLNRSLDAWERGDRADIVAVKCLFLFARTEGYPVREEWHRLLSNNDRNAATRLLNHRTSEVDLAPSKVGSIRRSLEHYLQYHTEIRIDSL